MKNIIIYLCWLLPLSVLGQNITHAEYFINTDPGFGNGTSIAIPTPSDVVDLNFTVNTASLSEGLHSIFVRTQDENGIWGLVQMRTFYKPNITNTQAANITAIEYAIDIDAGIGQNTIVNVNPANPTIDMDFVVDVSSLSLGDHYLFIRAQDENGNWGITQMDTITINCDTAVVAFNTQNSCIGDTMLLTDLSTNVNTDALYMWDVDGDGTTDYTNKDSIYHVFTAPGTYNTSLTIRNNLICEFTQTQTITVNPLPTANAGADQTICEGTTANLVATGGNSYTWSNGQNTASIAVMPTMTTTYTVTVTDANGCINADDVTVSVNPLPTANAGADQTICEGTTASLVATGGNSYTWSSGQNTASIAVTPTMTTTYTVTVTDANGCTNTDNVIITVNSVTIPTITQQVDTLTASSASSYQWFLDGNIIVGATGQTLVVTQNGDYTVQVVDINGCTTLSNIFTVISVSTSTSFIERIKIYPNPFRDYLIIENGQGQAKIYNTVGQLIQQFQILNKEYQLMTKELAEGQYILQITRENGGIITKRFIKR